MKVIGIARLLLVCGLPGSGKTTLSRQLQVTTGAIRMCPDEWIAALGFDGYDEDARGRVEALQWALAQELLKAGQNVILEFGFWSRMERDRMRESARAMGARVELRYCRVPLDELWARLEARNQSLPEATFAVRREDLEVWATEYFEEPGEEELQLFDDPIADE
jgi:predicted kinase